MEKLILLTALLFTGLIHGQSSINSLEFSTEDFIGESIVAIEGQKTRAYKKELVNDTLYIYYEKTWPTFGVNTTCAVYNCQDDHTGRAKWRIPFYIKDNHIVEGEKQYPFYETREREVVKVERETIEKWK